MWFKASKEDPSMPRVPEIKVYNLPELLILMESGQHADYGFFPSTAAVEAVKEVRGQHGTRARPMFRLAPF